MGLMYMRVRVKTPLGGVKSLIVPVETEDWLPDEEYFDFGKSMADAVRNGLSFEIKGVELILLTP